MPVTVAADPAETIARLQARIRAQDAIIAEQERALAHSRKIIERAGDAAKVGVWEFDLRAQRLTWTDSLYDIHEIPRGAAIDRPMILALYPEASRRELEEARSRAIAERTGFRMDIEMVTTTGRRRWLRVTASVECEDGVAARIFGLQQDITEEKALADRTRYLAEYDPMTGLANRVRFQARLAQVGAGDTLMLIDLDGFKGVNDRHGHAAGDTCLVEIGRRLADLCGCADLVARIGGDEFAVVLRPDQDLGAAERLARTVVARVGLPIAAAGHAFAVGASVGIATCRETTPEDLFAQADAALYAVKRAGRNGVSVFGRDPRPATRVAPAA